MRPLVFASALASLVSLAGAQSRSSTVYLAAGNAGNSLFGYGADYSGTGAFRSLDQSKSWTGMDSVGETRTMTFDGRATAQADYGRLRTRIGGTVSNMFYNSDNPTYYNGGEFETPNEDGVADTMLAASIVGFTDVLSFSGVQAGYRARYTFFIEGNATGDNVSANLRCQIGSNAAEQYDVNLSSGTVAQYWTTDAYVVGGNFQQTAQVQFTNRFDAYTGGYGDGATVSGMADFSSTITLSAIGVYDANDNLVANYSITGASGTVYPVPEPASMVALGLGALGVLRRRRLSPNKTLR